MADDTSGQSENISENANGEAPNNPGANVQGPSSIVTYFVEKKIDGLLLITRIATVIFTILFLFPLAGAPHSYYQKALLSNAATSALRLHQRVPQFQLSRDFFVALFVEDSCHYLFYSLIFVPAFPMTMVLLPLVVFAVLHASSSIINAYRTIGETNAWLSTRLNTFVQLYQQGMLRIIATAEIVIFPTILISILSGQMNILMPFIYYRFLTLRYTSRRNPYNRQMFYEFRVSVEQLAAHPRCPGIVANIFHRAISLVSRLAPTPA